MTDTLKKLSHSGWVKYLTCGHLYFLHYVKRLRPSKLNTNLLFGSAMDDALNAMLLKNADPYEVFKDSFKLEDMLNAEINQYDYEPRIFTKEQMEKVDGENDNYKAWASLRIKGRLLLQAYEKQILPQITHIYHVQKELDGRSGILDAIVEIKGHGKVLLDHKTSARAYQKGAVHASTQLALYANAEGIDKIGFAVLIKQINLNAVKTCLKCKAVAQGMHKTCAKIKNGLRCHGEFNLEVEPEGVVQLLIEDVEPMTKEIVEQSFKDVANAIDQKVFPKNLGACGKMYGKPCPYIEYCWKADKTGLDEK